MTYRKRRRSFGGLFLLIVALVASVGSWTAAAHPSTTPGESATAAAWSEGLPGLPIPVGLDASASRLQDARDGTGKLLTLRRDESGQREVRQHSTSCPVAKVPPCPPTAERLPYHATAPPNGPGSVTVG